MSNSPIKYTSFDFASLKQDFITFLQSKGTFQDYNFEGANITTIEEMIAGMGDQFDFFLNAIANEVFLETCDLYENGNKLVELIGYNPAGPQSATITVNLAANFNIAQLDDYFTLPAWETTLTSKTPSPDGKTIKYLLTETTTFVADITGANIFNKDVYLIQGDLNTENFIGTGLPYQKYEISSPNALIITDYISLTIDGNIWTQVDSFYSDNTIIGTSKVFTVRYNKNQLVEISFGNGIMGAIPNLNSNIIVSFIDTLASDGKIGINQLTAIDQSISIKDAYTGSNKTAITFAVTQNTISDGGDLAETLQDIQNIAPQSYKAQKRLTSTDDHKALLLQNFGNFIYDVKVLNSKEYWNIPGNTLSPTLSGRYYNNLYLYILPKYSDTLPGLLLQSIITFLETYKYTTINYVFESFDFVNIDILVGYKKSTSSLLSSSTLTTNIQNAIKTYFQRTNRSIGEEIRYSDILGELQALSGMSSVTLALSSDHTALTSGWSYDNIQLGWNQFPKLGQNISINYNGIGI